MLAAPHGWTVNRQHWWAVVDDEESRGLVVRSCTDIKGENPCHQIDNIPPHIRCWLQDDMGACLPRPSAPTLQLFCWIPWHHLPQSMQRSPWGPTGARCQQARLRTCPIHAHWNTAPAFQTWALPLSRSSGTISCYRKLQTSSEQEISFLHGWWSYF